MKETILKTINLTKKYKDFKALDEVNIKIEKDRKSTRLNSSH